MLLIYSDIRSARLSYILKTFFTDFLKVPYELTYDASWFKDYPHEKISYGKERIAGEFFIARVDILIEGPVTLLSPGAFKIGSNSYLFPVDQPADLPYDIFAAAFFMITRYEEYLPFTPDDHGRFSSSSSLSAKYYFLQHPVVDEWIMQLSYALHEKFPGFLTPSSKFSAIMSYDIDVAYEYKGRGILRNVGSTVKDLLKLDFDRILSRFKVYLGLINDSYDSFNEILHSCKKSNLEPLFFFLVGNYSAHDKNLPYNSSQMKSLINELSQASAIGVHPSYLSSLNSKMMSVEKKRMERISGKKITRSRQHFLKLSLPGTYRNLILAGITEDFTMGFADAPGFRAGTSKPFYFYDLQKEEATTLKVFPITFMDGNFIKHLRMQPSEAMTVISQLIASVHAVNGTFISLWHNHTLSNKGMYKGWKFVHDTMIKEISDLKDIK